MSSRVDTSELVAQARCGDAEAFSSLVRAFRPRLLMLLRQHLRTEDELDDAFSETLYRAWRNLDQLRDPAKFGPWLMTIGRHSALRIARIRSREVELTEAPEDRVADEGFASSSIDREVVSNAIERLRAKHPEMAEALVLRHMLDLSYEEIAELQGVSLGTVASRMSRARRQLQGILLG